MENPAVHSKTQSTNYNPVQNDPAQNAYLQSKALGGAGQTGNAELAEWYEQAYAEYQDLVNNGGSPEDIAQLRTWMEWAYQQLNGGYGQSSSWNDPFGAPEGASGSAPQGAFIGTEGNYVYDQAESTCYYNGDPTTSDIWSFDNTLECNSAGATITYEITQEGNPPEPVLKVIVKGPGGEQVFKYHNFDHPDFKLTIKAANVDGVSGSVPAEIEEKISVEKWTSSKSNEGEKPEASMNGEAIEGEPVDGEENNYYYEAPTVQDVFDFRPQAGEDETHYVMGNCNISTPLSSEVRVQPSDNPEYDWMVIVEHKDGSKDIFYGKNEFTVNINSVEEYVTFDMNADGIADDLEPGKVPDELKDIVTINGGVSGTNSSGNPDDTQPDEVEEYKGTLPVEDGANDATYNSNANVELTVDTEDDVQVHHIYGENFVLNASNYQDTFKVEKWGDDYLITVTGADGKKEYYVIDDSISSITINGTKVELDETVQGDSKIKGPSLEGSGEAGGKANEVLEELKSATGKSEDQILSALQGEFPQYNTLEKLVSAINSGEFPPQPGTADFAQKLEKLIKFIYALDPTFSGLVNSTKWESASLIQNLSDATARLVNLLDILYHHEHNISVTYPDLDATANNPRWTLANEFTFDGTNYEYTGEKGRDGEVANYHDIIVQESHDVGNSQNSTDRV